MRLVIDTNLVLSALVFQSGNASLLRKKWQSGQLKPLVSRDTAEELIRALNYPKFKLEMQEQQELLADYLPFCEVVGLPRTPPETPLCRDPNDIKFLVLAITARAECILSGDQDLLVLDGQQGLVIKNLQAFLAQIDLGR